jgi:hypothetical protein
LLAIMVNESDMNEKSARSYTRDGKIYAKDGGLMADPLHARRQGAAARTGTCAASRGKDLMNPRDEHRAGRARARALARGGGVVRTTITEGRRQPPPLSGQRRTCPVSTRRTAGGRTTTTVPRYIDKGYARHYPHRIAVLDHAFATVMNTPSAGAGKGTHHHSRPGQARTRARPAAGTALQKLYSQIISSGACSPLALN